MLTVVLVGGSRKINDSRHSGKIHGGVNNAIFIESVADVTRQGHRVAVYSSLNVA